jgi:hypothetical protein
MVKKEKKMKVYHTQEEVNADIKDGVLAIEGNVTIECSIAVNAHIIVTAGDITAWNINAGNINAGNITAWNITAWDINAGDINARDINAWDITARDIIYYAFCCVYNSIKCVSIKAKREKHQSPICLDGKIEYISQKDTLYFIGKEIELKLDGRVYKAKIIEG